MEYLYSEGDVCGAFMDVEGDNSVFGALCYELPRDKRQDWNESYVTFHEETKHNVLDISLRYSLGQISCPRW